MKTTNCESPIRVKFCVKQLFDTTEGYRQQNRETQKCKR